MIHENCLKERKGRQFEEAVVLFSRRLLESFHVRWYVDSVESLGEGLNLGGVEDVSPVSCIDVGAF